jgi:hypothetical protein
MAKPGLTLSGSKNLLGPISEKQGWVLCVGAGVSRGAFPDWKQLVTRLAGKDCSKKSSKRLVSKLTEEFSLDALVQTAQNRLDIKEKDFPHALSEELYAQMKRRFGDDWPNIAKALSAASPNDLLPPEWKRCLKLLKREYPELTAIGLAKVIAMLSGGDVAPDAVISFNAETLLYALITGLIGQKEKTETTATLRRKKPLDRVTQSLSYRQRNRIPYYYCHGILPIPDGTAKFHKAIGNDKLVFSEGEYLQLANNTFSWQSSIFLSACSLKSLVFVGVSFTDPNMRRWLSWVQKNRVQELAALNAHGDSTSHYWIKAKRRSKKEMEWIEASVAHLGVRLIWIKNWKEMAQCLRVMTGQPLC